MHLGKIMFPQILSARTLYFSPSTALLSPRTPHLSSRPLARSALAAPHKKKGRPQGTAFYNGK